MEVLIKLNQEEIGFLKNRKDPCLLDFSITPQVMEKISQAVKSKEEVIKCYIESFRKSEVFSQIKGIILGDVGEKYPIQIYCRSSDDIIGDDDVRNKILDIQYIQKDKEFFLEHIKFLSEKEWEEIKECVSNLPPEKIIYLQE